MNIVAILAALLLTLITLYFAIVQAHHGVLYVLAAILAVILLIVLIIPYASARSL